MHLFRKFVAAVLFALTPGLVSALSVAGGLTPEADSFLADNGYQTAPKFYVGPGTSTIYFPAVRESYLPTNVAYGFDPSSGTRVLYSPALNTQDLNDLSAYIFNMAFSPLSNGPGPQENYLSLSAQGARAIFAEDNAFGNMNGFHVLFEGVQAEPRNTTPQHFDVWNNQAVLVTLLHNDLDVFGGIPDTNGANYLLDIRLLEAVSPAVVPLPAGGWLLFSCLGALVAVRRRKTAA